jgi:hypothetical protein
MTGERPPSRPIDAYKEIIDQLVTETSHGVNERLVVREKGFSETSDSRICFKLPCYPYHSTALLRSLVSRNSMAILLTSWKGKANRQGIGLGVPPHKNSGTGPSFSSSA